MQWKLNWAQQGENTKESLIGQVGTADERIAHVARRLPNRLEQPGIRKHLHCGGLAAQEHAAYPDVAA